MTILRYLTGIEPENGCAIVDKTGTTLYTDMRYMEAAEKLLQGTDVTPFLYNQKEVLERLAEVMVVVETEPTSLMGTY